MEKTINLKTWLTKETNVDVDWFEKTISDRNEDWIDELNRLHPESWLSSAFDWEENKQDGINWVNISLAWEKKVNETKRGTSIVLGWDKEPESKKETYCVMCCAEYEFQFNKRNCNWKCSNCGSVLSEGIVERDEEIKELRAKLDSYQNESPLALKEIKRVEQELDIYSVYLQQKVEELERVILTIPAYSLQEAIDKATKMYSNGEINQVDFESIGERDLTLVPSNEWLVTKDEFHYSVQVSDTDENMYFEHKVYGEEDSISIEIKDKRVVDYDGAISISNVILAYLKRIGIDTSFMEE